MGTPKANNPTLRKTQEQLAGVETILSAGSALLTVAAQFTAKDLSPVGRNLLTGINLVTGISTGIAFADWLHEHNSVLDIDL